MHIDFSERLQLKLISFITRLKTRELVQKFKHLAFTFVQVFFKVETAPKFKSNITRNRKYIVITGKA